MRLSSLVATALFHSFVLASGILSINPERATMIMQRVLTKTTSDSDLDGLARSFGEVSMPEGCTTMNLHNRVCRILVVQLLCKSGAVVTKAEIEAAGTKLEDPDVLRILCTSASKESVTEASLSILKKILTTNLFDSSISPASAEIAKFCCASIKACQILLPASYVNHAVSKANLELLRNIIDCGVTRVPSSALSTAFLDDEKSLEMTMMLIEAGGDPNACASTEVPIAFELIKQCPDFSREMLHFMIDMNLDLNTFDNQALTLFDVAIKHGRFDLAVLLDKINAPTGISDDVHEIADEDHFFNWSYFQFIRRHLLVMAAVSQNGNAWNSLNPDLIFLISLTLFDVLVPEEDQ